MSDAARVERVIIPPGLAGTDATVDVMARAAMGRWGAGSAIIRDKAVDIIRQARVRERDQAGEVAAIHEFVKSHLRYVRDPLWYEFVTHPETLLESRADGDCDDHVVLESALLGSIGIPSRFVTYSFKGQPPSHVAMHAKVGRDWIPLDPIVKDQLAGWEVPDYDGRKLYGISTPMGVAKTVFNIPGLVGAIISGVLLWFFYGQEVKKYK